MLRFKEFLKSEQQKAANTASLFRSTRKTKPTLMKKKSVNEGKASARPENEGIVSKQDLLNYIEQRPETTVFIKFTPDGDLYLEFLQVEIGGS